MAGGAQQLSFYNEASDHGCWWRSIALRMVTSLWMTATSATLGSLPAARRR